MSDGKVFSIEFGFEDDGAQAYTRLKRGRKVLLEGTCFDGYDMTEAGMTRKLLMATENSASCPIIHDPLLRRDRWDGRASGLLASLAEAYVSEALSEHTERGDPT